MSTIARPLGIYVHWPFCVSKCPYCDFNSHVVQSIDLEQWTTAYLNELKFSHQQTLNHQVQTIFFGGGTPSLMPPSLMAKIIDTIQSLWSHSDNLEITFEANPTSVEAERFKAFKSAGANRVSIGIQAFNDKDLKFLGRPHSLEEGIKAIESAHRSFERVSFDLIYARPNQNLDDWSAELSSALTYAPTHISLYQLTIEPGTTFHTSFARGDFPMPNEHLSAELYDLTDKILNSKGFRTYEVSNYATPGEECRHNLMYWKYNDYVGIGPGAHGRITLDGVKYATRRHRAPQLWLDACLKNQQGQHELIPLSSYEELTELMLMGLRLHSGIELQRVVDIIHQTPADFFGQKWTALQTENLIEIQNECIVPTKKGRLKLNGILDFLFG
ncbi:MAG: radical SAM family heme chaperone HemW [Alphaproteobacteria bacterium]|nr:radical SAM family heme chaperone HemW [Alphaproteobacteria bacterium]